MSSQLFASQSRAVTRKQNNCKRKRGDSDDDKKSKPGRQPVLLTKQHLLSADTFQQMRSERLELSAASSVTRANGSTVALVKYKNPLDPNTRTSLTSKTHPQTCTLYSAFRTAGGHEFGQAPLLVKAETKLLTSKQPNKGTQRSKFGVQDYDHLFDELQPLGCSSSLEVEKSWVFTDEDLKASDELQREVGLVCRLVRCSTPFSEPAAWRVERYRFKAREECIQRGVLNTQILRLDIRTDLAGDTLPGGPQRTANEGMAVLSVLPAGTRPLWTIYLGFSPVQYDTLRKRSLRVCDKLKKNQYDSSVFELKSPPPLLPSLEKCHVETGAPPESPITETDQNEDMSATTETDHPLTTSFLSLATYHDGRAMFTSSLPAMEAGGAPDASRCDSPMSVATAFSDLTEATWADDPPSTPVHDVESGVADSSLKLPPDNAVGPLPPSSYILGIGWFTPISEPCCMPSS